MSLFLCAHTALLPNVVVPRGDDVEEYTRETYLVVVTVYVGSCRKLWCDAVFSSSSQNHPALFCCPSVVPAVPTTAVPNAPLQGYVMKVTVEYPGTKPGCLGHARVDTRVTPV